MLCSICCLLSCTLTIRHSWNVEMVPLWVFLHCPVGLILPLLTSLLLLVASVWCLHQHVSWHNKCSKWLRNMAELLVSSLPVSTVVLPKGPRSVTLKEVWLYLRVLESCHFERFWIFTWFFILRCGDMHCYSRKAHWLPWIRKDKPPQMHLPCSWWSRQNVGHGFWATDQENCWSN